MQEFCNILTQEMVRAPHIPRQGPSFRMITGLRSATAKEYADIDRALGHGFAV